MPRKWRDELQFSLSHSNAINHRATTSSRLSRTLICNFSHPLNLITLSWMRSNGCDECAYNLRSIFHCNRVSRWYWGSWQTCAQLRNVDFQWRWIIFLNPKQRKFSQEINSFAIQLHSRVKSSFHFKIVLKFKFQSEFFFFFFAWV